MCVDTVAVIADRAWPIGFGELLRGKEVLYGELGKKQIW